MYLLFVVGSRVFCYSSRPRGPWFDVCMHVHNNNTLQHETCNHSKQYTFADLNNMLFVITLLFVINLTILSLAYHFMGAMRDRWGLKRPPCSKWGMTENV